MYRATRSVSLGHDMPFRNMSAQALTYQRFMTEPLLSALVEHRPYLDVARFRTLARLVEDSTFNENSSHSLKYAEIYAIGSSALFNTTSWPDIEISYFMMGAYVSAYDLDFIPSEDDADQIALWFFLVFANRLDNDRMLQADQKRRLRASTDHGESTILDQMLARHASDERQKGAVQKGAVSEQSIEIKDIAYLRPKSQSLDRVSAGEPAGQSSATPSSHAVRARSLALDEMISFSINGNSDKFALARTWHEMESHGRWSNGHAGLIAFTLDGTAANLDLWLDIDLTPDLRSFQRNMPFSLTLNGHSIYSSATISDLPGRLQIDVLPHLVRTGSDFNIVGFHTSPFTPADFQGGDARSLGINVRRLWVREDA